MPTQVVEHGPSPRPRPSGGRWFLVLLLVVAAGMAGLLIGLAGSVVSSGDTHHLEEKYHSLDKHGHDKIAVITVEGTIMEGDGFVKKQIDRVRDDKSVKAVVLRVNSPGGTVTGSDFIYHHLVKLRQEREIPIVVSMGSLAASGGYYVAMAAGTTDDIIFAEPTCWTGSIGVVIPHYDLSRLANEHGLFEDSVKSHRLKAMGSPLSKMTDEERKIFQDLVDESFENFKGIVKSGRPKLADDKLTQVATGQVFTAAQAQEHGLVDKIGFIEAAIDRALELGKLDKAHTRVVKYHQPLGLFSTLLESRAPQRSFDLAALLNLSTPRAWYLFTWPLAAQ